MCELFIRAREQARSTNGRRLSMTPNALPGTSLRVKIKATSMVFTLLVIFTLILSACGTSGTSSSTSSKKVLKIATQSYDFAQSGWNPYNGHPNAVVLGLVYETLYFLNFIDASFTPMRPTTILCITNNT